MEAEARVELTNIQREERLVERSVSTDENQNETSVDDGGSVNSMGGSTAPSGSNGSPQAATSRQDQQQNAFNVQLDSLNGLITSSNANGQYAEPGQLLNQIA
jgi:hypothetical protein